MMEILTSYFQIILDYLVIFVDKIGYLGIFIGMFLESTFIPIPSEIIMIPAGIAASAGKFNIHLIIFVGVIGNLFGAIFNYYLAVYCGRPILLKIGKYFFMKEKTIVEIEKFFNEHGSFSTFTGRLIPGVRHYISLPAGIARMNFRKFCFYTFLGSSIWVTILTYLGYFIGENQEQIKEYLHLTIIACLTLCFVLLLGYLRYLERQK
ncbi:MAG: membrane protein DedA with SNARE-associated domain [Rickettsiales bacterium]|jgi:membrane protein DedA with SNARE-associated domain